MDALHIHAAEAVFVRALILHLNPVIAHGAVEDVEHRVARAEDVLGRRQDDAVRRHKLLRLQRRVQLVVVVEDRVAADADEHRFAFGRDVVDVGSDNTRPPTARWCRWRRRRSRARARTAPVCPFSSHPPPSVRSSSSAYSAASASISSALRLRRLRTRLTRSRASAAAATHQGRPDPYGAQEVVQLRLRLDHVLPALDFRFVICAERVVALDKRVHDRLVEQRHVLKRIQLFADFIVDGVDFRLHGGDLRTRLVQALQIRLGCRQSPRTGAACPTAR